MHLAIHCTIVAAHKALHQSTGISVTIQLLPDSCLLCGQILLEASPRCSAAIHAADYIHCLRIRELRRQLHGLFLLPPGLTLHPVVSHPTLLNFQKECSSPVKVCTLFKNSVQSLFFCPDFLRPFPAFEKFR